MNLIFFPKHALNYCGTLVNICICMYDLPHELSPPKSDPNPRRATASSFLSLFQSIALWNHTHPKWHFLIKSPPTDTHISSLTITPQLYASGGDWKYISMAIAPPWTRRRGKLGGKKDREVPVIRIFCCLGSSGRGRGDRRRRRRSPRWRSWCGFSGFDDLLAPWVR